MPAGRDGRIERQGALSVLIRRDAFQDQVSQEHGAAVSGPGSGQVVRRALFWRWRERQFQRYRACLHGVAQGFVHAVPAGQGLVCAFRVPAPDRQPAGSRLAIRSRQAVGMKHVVAAGGVARGQGVLPQLVVALRRRIGRQMGLQRLGGRVLRVQCLYEGKKRLRVARGEAFERMAHEHQLGMLPDAHGQTARLGLRTVLAYPRVGT
jgi:hypothetical protein